MFITTDKPVVIKSLLDIKKLDFSVSFENCDTSLYKKLYELARTVS